MKLVCNLFGHNMVKNEESKSYYDRFVCSHNCEFYDSGQYNNKWEKTFWESENWEFLRMCLIVLLIMTLSIALITVPFVIGYKLQCNEYAKMGIDVYYNLFTGCMANHPKFGYIPVEEYFRVINLYVP